MRAKLVQIGNSRGVRIPKTVIEQARLGDEVELEVKGSTVQIRAAKKPREGWEDSFRRMAARGDDVLIETPAPTWDETEWQWR